MTPRLARSGAAVCVVLALVLAACGGDVARVENAVSEVAATSTVEETQGETTVVFPPEGNPLTLSEWRQLDLADGQLAVAEGVTPYTLNSALFSDYAHKLRTIWVPDGSEPAVYQSDEVFDFPIGTVITKTFWYPTTAEDNDAGSGRRVSKVIATSNNLAEPLDLAAVRLVETRVLVHRAEGWVALPYVWNEDQTAAELSRTGDLVPLTLVDADVETPFTYVVPNVNQCSGCHATNHTTGVIVPIGPKARHLNTEVDLGDGVKGQLGVWQERGLLGVTPAAADIARSAVWDDASATIDARARAYLDINCAHCHNRVGPADTSGLFLEPSTELGSRLGVCKPPIAAGTGTGGRLVGIDPGQPEDSIFVFRMESTDPGAMMPELGRALTHDEGVEVISSWIGSLTGSC